MADRSIGEADFEALAAEILAGGNALRFRAHGGSMHPFIKDGDVLEVRPIDTSAIRRGDVILCRNEGDRVVVHRVIRLEREGNHQEVLVVQGDALARPDGLVSREHVLGRVVTVERGGRHIKVDAGLPWVLGRLWIEFAPFSQKFYRVLAALKNKMC